MAKSATNGRKTTAKTQSRVTSKPPAQNFKSSDNSKDQYERIDEMVHEVSRLAQ